jgi:hypothetical protein
VLAKLTLNNPFSSACFGAVFAFAAEQVLSLLTLFQPPLLPA